MQIKGKQIGISWWNHALRLFNFCQKKLYSTGFFVASRKNKKCMRKKVAWTASSEMYCINGCHYCLTLYGCWHHFWWLFSFSSSLAYSLSLSLSPPNFRFLSSFRFFLPLLSHLKCCSSGLCDLRAFTSLPTYYTVNVINVCCIFICKLYLSNTKCHINIFIKARPSTRPPTVSRIRWRMQNKGTLMLFAQTHKYY